MYRLSLSEFKGVKHAVVEFESASIILLDGYSGSGKSTIVEALSFVLYGQDICKKVDNSYTLTKKKPTVKVSLEFPDGSYITRSKNPTLLDGLTPDGRHVDQQYINDKFGDPRVWGITTYLRQGGEYEFLTSVGGKEKLNILQKLDAPGYSNGELDTYSSFLQKSDTLVKETKEKVHSAELSLTSAKVKLDEYRKIHAEVLSACPEPWSEETKIATAKDYNCEPGWDNLLRGVQKVHDDTLSLWKAKITKTRQEMDSLGMYNTRKTQLEALIKAKREELENIHPPDDNKDDLILELEKLNADMVLHDAMKEYTIKLNLRNKSLANLSELEKTLPPEQTLKYTETTLRELEMAYKWPSKQEIDNELGELSQTAARLCSLDLYNKTMSEKQALRDSITAAETSLNTCPTSPSSDEITRLQKAILELSVSSAVLSCPSCGTGLYLVGGRLEHAPDMPKVSLKELEAALMAAKAAQAGYETRLRIENKIAGLKKRLESIPDVEKPPALDTPMDMNTIIKRKGYLETGLKYSHLPRDVNIEEERKRLSLSQTRDNLLKQMEAFKRSIPVVEEPVGKLNYPSSTCDELLLRKSSVLSRIHGVDDTLSKRLHIAEDISGLEKTLASLGPPPVVEYDISKLEEKVHEVLKHRDTCIEAVRAQQILEEHSIRVRDVEECHRVYTEGLHRIETLTYIKTVLKTAQHNMFSDLLRLLSTSLSRLLTIMFDEPVVFEFQANCSDTDTHYNPNVTYRLLFGDNTVDTVGFKDDKSLSGGERARCSIAMALVFADLGKSPFFIVDETTACLDDNLKRTIVELVKEHLPNKTILFISHSIPPGHFDQTVDVESCVQLSRV